MPEAYILTIQLEAPLIITYKQLGKTLYSEYEYIPGSTLRGALLGELRRIGENISKEIENPSLIVQPAYPVKDEVISEPSHPFIYECKICKEIMLSESIEEFYQTGKINMDKLILNTCKKDPNHKGTIKSLGGKLIVKKRNKIEKISLENVALDSVGISKKIKTSEIGMLYNYIGIAPGYKFKSIIKGNEEIIDKIKNIKTIHIGRGISRGLGKAKINLEKINFNNEKRIEKSIIDDKLIIKSISPVFDLTINNDRLVTVLDLNIEKLNKWKIINGNNKAITGFTKVSGFSSYKGSNVPKPLFNAIKEGSLFFFEIKDKKEIIDYLSNIEITGIQPFNFIGINHIRVIKE